MSEARTAVVFKSTGSWYALEDGVTGEQLTGRIQGKLRIAGSISSTNPIAVGDVVRYSVEGGEEGVATISGVEDRRNYIIRTSPHNRNQRHIVASNLDAALLIVTLAEPRTSMGFVDRFLITAEAYGIPVTIVINKSDLLRSEDDAALLAHWQSVYATAGYSAVAVCAQEPHTLEQLHPLLAGRTVLFSGHSGVGKSTLINALVPDLDLRTGEVSGWSGKGQHTTTFAEMHRGTNGSRIIDTPGIKEFGLMDVLPGELAHYFPEMRMRMADCRFNNCMHIAEPGCAVLGAISDTGVTPDRYGSYRTILDTLGDTLRR